jgi:hypothetical protein
VAARGGRQVEGRLRQRHVRVRRAESKSVADRKSIRRLGFTYAGADRSSVFCQDSIFAVEQANDFGE